MDGSNEWWQAFYFSNSRQPLAKVWLNGHQLQRSLYGYWVHSGQLELAAAAVFKLQGFNGKVVSAAVSGNLTIPHWLGKQF